MKRLHIPSLILLLAVTGIGPACGLIVNSPHQTVVVVSDPPGAEVWTGPKELQYWTPALINLPRKHDYLLRFAMPGYRDDSLAVRRELVGEVLAADILFTAGIGVAADAVTGSWYHLTPGRASVMLQPIGGELPFAIAVRVVGQTMDVVSSRPGVMIHVDQR